MKKKSTLIFLLIIIALGFSCSDKTGIKKGKNVQLTSTNKEIISMTNYFPFKISENSGQYTISADIESPELYEKYEEFFSKHGYSGNGYCWEGHILQILERLDPTLIPHINFDPEAGQFYAYTDTKVSQIKFVELLSPIFSDITKLEEYVKKASRERIDD